MRGREKRGTKARVEKFEVERESDFTCREIECLRKTKKTERERAGEVPQR